MHLLLKESIGPSWPRNRKWVAKNFIILPSRSHVSFAPHNLRPPPHNVFYIISGSLENQPTFENPPAECLPPRRPHLPLVAVTRTSPATHHVLHPNLSHTCLLRVVPRVTLHRLRTVAHPIPLLDLHLHGAIRHSRSTRLGDLALPWRRHRNVVNAHLHHLFPPPRESPMF